MVASMHTQCKTTSSCGRSRGNPPAHAWKSRVTTSTRQIRVARGTVAVRVALQTLILKAVLRHGETRRRETRRHSARLWAQAPRATGDLPRACGGPPWEWSRGSKATSSSPRTASPPSRHTRAAKVSRWLTPASCARPGPPQPRMPHGRNLQVLRGWSTGRRTLRTPNPGKPPPLPERCPEMTVGHVPLQQETAVRHHAVCAAAASRGWPR